MHRAARLVAVLAFVLAIADVALPPVVESHAEAGFCSADCPVQHPGHGGAIRAPQQGDDGHPLVVLTVRALSEIAAPALASTALDAPRAPPTA